MKIFLHKGKPRVPLHRWLRNLLWIASVCSAFLTTTALHAQTAMSGTYTVCASGCDYSSVSAAVTAVKSNGVNGKVVFKISGGSYNESVSISGAITGASKTNTITFQGVGAYGSGTGVTRIYYSGTTLSLSNVSYVIFRDIKIENTSSGYGMYLYYDTYLRFYNCNVVTTYGSTSMYPLYDYYSSNIYMDKCRFYGGYYSYRYLSSSATNDTTKNTNFIGSYQYGLYQYYGNGNYHYNNSYDSLSYSYGYPIYDYGESNSKYEGCSFGAGSGYYTGGYLYYGTNLELTKNIFGNFSGIQYGIFIYLQTALNCHENYFRASYYSAYIYYPNYASASSPFLFYNNFVSNTSSGYPMYVLDYSYSTNLNVHFWHNTSYNSTSNYAAYFYNYYGSAGWDIRNNNFYSQGGTAFYMAQMHASDQLSGNNFYVPSGNLASINGSNYTTVSALISGLSSLGLGKYSQSVSTSFKSAPGDLHYTSSSSLPWGRAISSPVKVDKDFDGDARCTLFATSGADEGNPSWTTPTASFTGPSTIYDGSPVVFKNAAKTSDPYAYKWYVDGKLISDSIDLATTALRSPSAKVTLVTQSCGGKDSVTKTFTVKTPTKAPVTDFISNINVIRVGEVVKFNDLTLNYPSFWAWEVSPKAYSYFGSKIPTFAYTAGDSTRPNVSMRFDYPGKYKICLTTKNAVGSGGTECKSSYIEVLGSYNLQSGTNQIKETRGYLYDNGGPNGNYSTGSYSASINPGCAKTVYLIFNYFNTYCGYDYVRIWDGPDNKSTSTEITPCTSNINYGVYGPGLTGGPSTTCYTSGIVCTPKTTDTFKAKSGKMYLQMNSVIAGYSGFEAYFWSDPKAQKLPDASFTSLDSVCTNSSVDFINTSTGDDLDYMWDMDGDLSYFEDTKKNTSYPFIFPGQYDITLIAKNCSGIDTFVKTITVFDPPTPKVNFHADNTNPTTNDIVYLIPDIKQCVDDYKWEVKKKYGAGTVTYMNGTSSSSEIPQVTLGDTGCYDVTLVASNVSGADSMSKKCHIYVKNPYCTPSVSNTIADLGISEVQFNTIDNITKQTGGYENYTPTVSTALEIGVSYPITVSRKTSANKGVRAVYIDWNADGDFSDTMEVAAMETPGRALSWTDTITVPAFAKVGATVMRVIMTQGSQTPDPCSSSFGEFEDYRLYVSNDKTPPVITLTGADTIRIEQGYSFTDPGATAYDNLSGNITSRISVNKGGFDILTPGTYIFTYNVKDDAGNAAAAKKRVVIVTPDKTPADLLIDADDTIMVGVFTSFTEPTSSAWDLVDGDLSADVKVNDPVDINVVDTYTVSYQVTDANNNTAKKLITVIVMDTTAPVLTMMGANTIYHDVNTPYTDAGVFETDNYYKGTAWDNMMAARIQTQSNLDVTKLGTYTITYSLTDFSGNVAKSLTRTIIIQDTMAPAVTLNGGTPVTLEVYDVFNDMGVNIKDNYYTSFTIDTSGSFYDAFPSGKATKLGKYTIVYKITDGSGNVTTVTREIFVVDTQAPVISLLGDPSVNVCRWAVYQDSGYTVKDNYWTGNGITVTKEGSFVNNQTLKEGIYTLRYKAVDSAGNIAYTSYRIINVLSPTDPGCITGIADAKDMGSYVSIYPNPSTGVFTISSKLPLEKDVRITVTNMLGQEVAIANNLSLGNGQFQVDMRSQSAGVYLLNIYTSKQVITKRIVISK